MIKMETSLKPDYTVVIRPEEQKGQSNISDKVRGEARDVIRMDNPELFWYRICLILS